MECEYQLGFRCIITWKTSAEGLSRAPPRATRGIIIIVIITVIINIITIVTIITITIIITIIQFHITIISALDVGLRSCFLPVGLPSATRRGNIHNYVYMYIYIYIYICRLGSHEWDGDPTCGTPLRPIRYKACPIGICIEEVPPIIMNRPSVMSCCTLPASNGLKPINGFC